MNTEKMMFRVWVPTFLLCGMMLCASAAAEEFKDFTLKALDGTEVSTESVRRDKALVVKLGATWCGYCQQETEELKKLRADFSATDLDIVDVYLLETPETVAAHAKDLPFKILLDEAGTIASLFGVTGIPVVMVVDPNGEIVYQGNYTPYGALRESVKSALAARKTEPSPETTADEVELRETAATTKTCLLCGAIEGSTGCTECLETQRATCPKCRRMKGSPGCCKSAVQLADAGLCPGCGHVKGSADCCKLQGKELCSSCGLVKDSAGCLKML
jgi:peroxiredoxin